MHSLLKGLSLSVIVPFILLAQTITTPLFPVKDGQLVAKKTNTSKDHQLLIYGGPEVLVDSKTGGVKPMVLLSYPAIMGPVGPKGDDGAAGIEGLQGPQGPAGPNEVTAATPIAPAVIGFGHLSQRALDS